MTLASFVPRGFVSLDAEGLFMESQMSVCNNGNYCPNNAISYVVCPKGKYCPKGTFTNTALYGVPGFTQICKDGVYCGELGFSKKGASSAYGLLNCTDGKFCQAGIAKDCPTGATCMKSYINDPERCQAGTFYNKTDSHFECYPCPVGSQCLQEGTVLPTPCERGFLCRTSHAFAPTRPCYAGHYCLGSMVGKPNSENTKINAIPLIYQPKTCLFGQFCYKGIYTNITNSSDILAPQRCLDGMVCTITDENNLSSLQCPPGYYCKAGFEPKAADPGYYVPGEGSVKQQACPLGTYSNIYAATTCTPCEAGTYNPSEAATQCIPCEEGSYRSGNSTNIYCSLCPAGTYNPEIGKTMDTDCLPCPPKKMCTKDGLKSIDDALPCEQGFYCEGGTNKINIKKCPAGFYCKEESSEKADFHLCPEGYYCDEGTNDKNKNKNPCPVGYFCYKGSMPSINDQGFNVGILLADNIDEIIQAKLIKGIEDQDTLPYEQCEDDKKIPQELIITYLKSNGGSEKCPSGTTSKQRAICLGNCTKDLGKIEEIIPFDSDLIKNQINSTVSNLNLQIQELLNSYDNEVVPLERVYRVSRERAEIDEASSGSAVLLESITKQETKSNANFEGSYEGQNRIKQEANDYIEHSGFASDFKKINYESDSNNKMRRVLQESNSSQADQTNNTDSNDTSAAADSSSSEESNSGEPFTEEEKQKKIESTLLLPPFGSVTVEFDLSNVPEFLKFMYDYQISIYSILTRKINGQEVIKQASLPYNIIDEYFKEGNLQKTSVSFKLFNFFNEEIFVKVVIDINNAIFINLKEYFQGIAKFKKFSPWRAEIGTSRAFFFVLTKDTFSDITLPYNLYEANFSNKDKDDNNLLLVNYIPPINDKNYTYERYINQNFDPFDEQFWDKQGLSELGSIVMPWIPFYSNCAGYDKNIVLYDLLEFNQDCSFPEEKAVRVVHEIPTQGFTPVSDSCNIRLICQYDDKSNISTGKFKRWFDISEPTILTYISAYPTDLNFISNIYAKEYSDKIEKSNLDFVGVLFNPIGLKDFIPEADQRCAAKHHKMVITYFQVNDKKKKIVNFDVELMDYSICINDQNIYENNKFYVEVLFFGVSYLELINNFQFEIPIFVLIFALIGMGIVLFFLGFWGFFYFKSNLKEPPSLKLKVFTKIFLLPIMKGLAFSFIIIFFNVFISWIFKTDFKLSGFNLTWGDLGNDTTDVSQENANKRLGLSLFVIYLIFSYHTSSNFIQKPTEHEFAQLQLEALRKQIFENNYNEFENQEKEEEDRIILQDLDNQLYPLLWKARMYTIKGLMMSIYLTIKLEFSYSVFFGKNVYTIFSLILIFDVIIEELLLKFIFLESMLATPFISLNRIITLITMLGSDSFQSYILIYIMKCCINFTIRLTIDPIADKVVFLLRKYSKARLKDVEEEIAEEKKNIKKEHKNLLILNAIEKKVSWKIRIKEKFWGFIVNSCFKEEEVPDKFFNYDDEHYNEERKNTVEVILRIMQNFAASTIAVMFIPIFIILGLIYKEEMKFTIQYGILETEMNYYLVFSLIVIIPEMLINIIIVHIIELYYGFRIQEYVTYCDYRYRIRTTEFIRMKNTMDPSIGIIWRSLDAMLFSDQFYFITSLSISTGLFGIIGFSVIVRMDYDPLNDPMFFPYLLLIGLILYLFYLLCILIKDVSRIWKLKDKNIYTDGNLLDFLKTKSKIKDIQRVIHTDLFKHKFLSANKNWILKNLENILGVKENEGEVDQNINENLMDIYQKAINYQALEKQIANKREVIKKDLQLLPYNQPFIGEYDKEFGVRLDISNDSDNDIPLAISVPANKKGLLRKNIYYKKVAMLWLFKAREIQRYKNWSLGTLEENTKTKCRKCLSKFNLQVIQERSFEDLITVFKSTNEGNRITKDLWEVFYRKNQRFFTYCMECAYIVNLNRLKNKTLFNQILDVKDLVTEKAVNKKFNKPFVLGILNNWLYEARCKILFKKLNVKNKAAIDDVDDAGKTGRSKGSSS
eukprot:CAMPEP_0170539142 /NCGR_PEP_ID=MMETSP0209-20121228/103738_1 /TAXON_ID=665100 ORGANISM="Litonotus pictus, Strain P1" /NCGR_SAMPLE_ID=MMETSP0209 /ASSEMBLY_ACC=CAM_ASM_000301 /LENGTH=1999 /DNA_ID=CAMNT_0010840987 /DNA_START=1068 /DNA_END=7067 /DNA_ORIENTATION=-